MRNIKVDIIVEDEKLLPFYASAGAAGVDIRSNQDAVIQPGEIVIIKTGIRMKIEEGYELQLRSRSGMTAKSKVTVANSPGTIDSDYTGEIGLIMRNESKEPFVVNKYDRLAQGVFSEVIRADFNLTTSLEKTDRGDGGFGSTGK